MRSQLTRNVFRRLLSNEGLVFRCPAQSAILCRVHQRHVPASVVRAPIRRTFFGFSRKPEREHKNPQLAPGLATMVELGVRQRIQARTLPRDDLLKAWRSFFNHKLQNKEAVNNMQAGHALRTYKHLQSTDLDMDDRLRLSDMRKAMAVLKTMPKDDVTLHSEFARLLYKDCLQLSMRTGESNSEREKDLMRLVEVLTQTGNSSEARKLVFTQETSRRDMDWKDRRQRQLVYKIAMGFAKEDSEEELLKTCEMAEKAGILYNSRLQEIMVTFYASKDNVEATKQWYKKPKPEDNLAFPRAPILLKTILEFCIRNNELDWCKSIFREVLATEPTKQTWDVVLQWAAGALGKGVEDVERMIEVMVRRNPKDGSVRPDADTINGLVELAMSFNDSYLAERYITLGLKFGIRPNAKTYTLQMTYRAEANDLRGAQAAYELLQAEEVADNEDLPAINKYIRALCSAKTLDYDRIMSITSDLSERDKRLEAETVCALANMYLSRNETDELIDLLQSESYHYTMAERALIREVFLNFCLSPETSTMVSWNAYTLLNQLFDETPVSQRTLLMNNFFSRGRCDMASYVFGHMRAHTISDRRPVLDTYVQCFLGIASCADREALDMVHNMLKMDSSIEPNTTLYNSLMQAYTACEDADRALSFWDDITNSSEGPSYRSLEIVFWVCQRKHFGDVRAREIWRKMRRMEIEVTGKVFSAYVGALAGNGKLDEAKGVCELVPKELGLTMDVLTLGTFYNAIPGQNRKDLVEEWAKERYPDAWTELEKLGRTEQEEGHMLFNMKREFKA